ncbi:hypothetical protein CMUS01_02132 [Colletotrichum musicola]|uniref:Uncharacterized protein n=1 Tax=Colletotrichum musicola TaxID=2175873 RepID=A0A8H6U7E2_9PEZI|nr:hypothetical protein CMUS01_02132 [Colletotrichum musicola]
MFRRRLPASSSRRAVPVVSHREEQHFSSKARGPDTPDSTDWRRDHEPTGAPPDARGALRTRRQRLASFDRQRWPDSTKQVGELLGVLRRPLGLAVEEVLSRLTWVLFTSTDALRDQTTGSLFDSNCGREACLHEVRTKSFLRRRRSRGSFSGRVDDLSCARQQQEPERDPSNREPTGPFCGSVPGKIKGKKARGWVQVDRRGRPSTSRLWPWGLSLRRFDFVLPLSHITGASAWTSAPAQLL